MADNNGFASLGFVLGGGNSSNRLEMYMRGLMMGSEQNMLSARTQDALEQAQQRQQQAQARARLPGLIGPVIVGLKTGNLDPNTLGPVLETLEQAGLNPEQVTNSIRTLLQTNAEGAQGNPNLTDAERERLLLTSGRAPVPAISVQGQNAQNVFNPTGLTTTPQGQADINLKGAQAQAALENAQTNQVKAQNQPGTTQLDPRLAFAIAQGNLTPQNISYLGARAPGILNQLAMALPTPPADWLAAHGHPGWTPPEASAPGATTAAPGSAGATTIDEPAINAYRTFNTSLAQATPNSAGGTLRSINRLAGHLQTIQQIRAAENDQTHPGNVQFINNIKALYAQQFGKPAPATLSPVGQYISLEAARAAGNPTTTGEERDTLSVLGALNTSSPQFKSQLDATTALIKSQVEALHQQYTALSKPLGRPDDFYDRWLEPQTRAVLGVGTQPGNAGAVTPPGPMTRAEGAVNQAPPIGVTAPAATAPPPAGPPVGVTAPATPAAAAPAQAPVSDYQQSLIDRFRVSVGAPAPPAAATPIGVSPNG